MSRGSFWKARKFRYQLFIHGFLMNICQIGQKSRFVEFLRRKIRFFLENSRAVTTEGPHGGPMGAPMVAPWGPMGPPGGFPYYSPIPLPGDCNAVRCNAVRCNAIRMTPSEHDTRHRTGSIGNYCVQCCAILVQLKLLLVPCSPTASIDP